MDKIIGKTFQNTTVNLDFSSYEKCNFVKCMIHSEYGIFGLVNCGFIDCKLSLGGPAENIAKLIQKFFKDRPITFTK